jgi:hypothetical protein
MKVLDAVRIAIDQPSRVGLGNFGGIPFRGFTSRGAIHATQSKALCGILLRLTNDLIDLPGIVDCIETRTNKLPHAGPRHAAKPRGEWERTAK